MISSVHPLFTSNVASARSGISLVFCNGSFKQIVRTTQCEISLSNSSFAHPNLSYFKTCLNERESVLVSHHLPTKIPAPNDIPLVAVSLRFWKVHIISSVRGETRVQITKSRRHMERQASGFQLPHKGNI